MTRKKMVEEQSRWARHVRWGERVSLRDWIRRIRNQLWRNGHGFANSRLLEPTSSPIGPPTQPSLPLAHSAAAVASFRRPVLFFCLTLIPRGILAGQIQPFRHTVAPCSLGRTERRSDDEDPWVPCTHLSRVVLTARAYWCALALTIVLPKNWSLDPTRMVELYPVRLYWNLPSMRSSAEHTIIKQKKKKKKKYFRARTRATFDSRYRCCEMFSKPLSILCPSRVSEARRLKEDLDEIYQRQKIPIARER